MHKIVDPKEAGRIIRTLRNERKLTGAALGKRAGISQSRISKIENGLYHRVSRGDIMKILNILNPTQAIRQQLTASFAVRSNKAQNIQYSPRMWDVFSYEVRAKQIKIYLFSGVPAILQTLEYRVAGLRNHFGVSEDEVPAILKDTIKRQDLLWDTTRKYSIVLHQAALYSLRKDATAQLAQLDRVERMMGLPNVKIGIIPVEASLPAVEVAPFALHDHKLVTKTSINGDQTSRDEAEIDEYARLFSKLEEIAVYDDDAKQLIRRAMDYFSR